MNMMTGNLISTREGFAPLELLTSAATLPRQFIEPVRLGEDPVPVSLENRNSDSDRLFEAVANAKIWASRLAMRFSPIARSRIFKQLDMLHDPDDWMDGDIPVQLESFKSFIRCMLIEAIDGVPSLALTPSGNITALWRFENLNLNVEFFPYDKIRFLATRKVEGDIERYAGSTVTKRLSSILGPLLGGS